MRKGGRMAGEEGLPGGMVGRRAETRGAPAFSRGWTRPCAVRTLHRSVEEPGDDLPDEFLRVSSPGSDDDDDEKKGHHERRRERRDCLGPRGIRVVIAATPTRPTSHEGAPSRRRRSENQPPEVVVSTSDGQHAVSSRPTASDDQASPTATAWARHRPVRARLRQRIPGDSRSRFEWYWRARWTRRMRSSTDTAIEPAMTLFLEDDVVPTKRWRRSSGDSSRRTPTRRTAVPASLTSLCCTRRVWCKSTTASEAGSRRTPRRCSSARGWRRGSRRRCWTGSATRPRIGSFGT